MTRPPGAAADSGRGLISSRVLLLTRFLFGMYAGGLFIGTHMPQVRIEGPLPRTDLWIHVSVFGCWNGFMTASRVFGPALSRRNIALSTAVSLAYAAVDEGLQAIPALQRVAAIDDYAANALGILLAAAIMLTMSAAARLIRSLQEPR